MPSNRSRSQAIPHDKHVCEERNLVEGFFNKIELSPYRHRDGARVRAFRGTSGKIIADSILEDCITSIGAQHDGRHFCAHTWPYVAHRNAL